MAKDQVRVTGVLSACILAGVAGVLWGQNVPPAPGEQQREADHKELEADQVETLAEGAEGILSPERNSEMEAWAVEKESESREAESEIPPGD